MPLLRKGVFEARIPVFEVGSYSVRVTDPVTSKLEEQRFEVTPLSAERQRMVTANDGLDELLAHEAAEIAAQLGLALELVLSLLELIGHLFHGAIEIATFRKDDEGKKA